MTDENYVITPELASTMNTLINTVYDKYSEIVEIPELVELPTRLGDLLYFHYIEGIEDIIKDLEKAIYLPPEWIPPKTWTTFIPPNTYSFDKTFDYTDWNRWYIDLNILNNIETVPEQWNELNIDRYQSIWNGNASLEWEE